MKLKSIILSLVAIAVLASCGTSNNVVGGGIQKRKYNDGYYVSFGKKFNGKADIQKVESLLSDNSIDNTQGVNSESNALLSKNEEAIIISEVVTEPNIDEINDDVKLDSDKNTITTNSENENVSVVYADKESETLLTDDKTNGTYTRKNIRTVVSDSAAASESGLMLILLVILCFILPPLAIGIFEGITTRFWIDLILWLLGWGVGYWLLGGLGWLCTLIAVILALLVVLSLI